MIIASIESSRTPRITRQTPPCSIGAS